MLSAARRHVSAQVPQTESGERESTMSRCRRGLLPGRPGMMGKSPASKRMILALSGPYIIEQMLWIIEEHGRDLRSFLKRE